MRVEDALLLEVLEASIDEKFEELRHVVATSVVRKTVTQGILGVDTLG